MKWLEVCIESDDNITEEASMIFFEAGANGTQIQNPDEIKSLIDAAGAKELADYGDFSEIMDKYRAIAYFVPGTDLNLLKGALNERIDNFTFSWREADDDEWKGNWKKYYKPFNITAEIRIVPSWESQEIPDEKTIVMDPGMAFGTGTHESTSLCAGMIEEIIKKGDLLLDIGTGTGILAIIAAKHGSGVALAIDIDPAAIRTAEENFKLNNVDNAVVFLGELKDVEKFIQSKKFKAAFNSSNLKKAVFGKSDELKFDLIAANIVSDVIILLARDMKKHLRKGGSLVCSGIISEREPDVVQELKNSGFKNLRIRRKNKWTAICADT